MEYSLPAWFKADEIFTHNGNWYLGSVGSLHIGPYSDRETAETKSEQVSVLASQYPDRIRMVENV